MSDRLPESQEPLPIRLHRGMSPPESKEPESPERQTRGPDCHVQLQRVVPRGPVASHCSRVEQSCSQEQLSIALHQLKANRHSKATVHESHRKQQRYSRPTVINVNPRSCWYLANVSFAIARGLAPG